MVCKIKHSRRLQLLLPTTIVNQTTVPYNQTTIGTENSTTPQQSLMQSNQTGQAGAGGQQSQQQSNQTTIGTENSTTPQQSLMQSNQTGQGGAGGQQSNQSKGPFDQIGETVGKMIGGGKSIRRHNNQY